MQTRSDEIKKKRKKTMNSDQKILIIGSNSFSGSHFVNYALDLGFEVMGISRSKEPNPVFLPYKWKSSGNTNFVFYQHDLNTGFEDIKNRILLFKPGYIVNFAAQGMVAQSWENPEQWFNTNTLAHIRLHQFLKNCSFLKKYIHISTPEVYGSCNGYVKENINYYPSTPYAVSKAATDLSLMIFYKEYFFPVIIIRSANVYGSGQQLYRIIPKAVLFSLMKKAIDLHGGGKSIRSFVHIKDVSAGILKAMNDGVPGEIYHLASKKEISIRGLVQLIAQKMGVGFDDLVNEVDERPGKDNAYLLDCSKARDQLGWSDKISLEEGINETIAWIKNNYTILKKEPFDYIHKP